MTKIDISGRKVKKLRRDLKQLSPHDMIDQVTASKIRQQITRLDSLQATQISPKVWEEKRRQLIIPDPVVALYRKGEIDQTQFSAAEEIRDIWEALSRGRDLQAASMEPVIPSSGPYRAPLEKLPITLDATYRDKWVPWADSLNKNVLAVRCDGVLKEHLTWLYLMIEIAGYRYSLREIATRIRMRRHEAQKMVKNIFLEGLNRW